MAGLLRELKMEQRGCVMKAFKVLSSAGTMTLPVGGVDGTITDNGVGDYTITFTVPFERVIGAQACVAAANAMAYVSAISTTAITVKVTEADGATPKDATLYLWVLGSLAADET